MSDEEKKRDARETTGAGDAAKPEAASEAAVDPEREAKLKAAAEARAARAAAKAKAEADAAGAGGETAPEAEEPKPPSVRLPELERLQAILRDEVAEDAIDEAYLNELNDDMPTLVLKGGHWPAAARLLKDHGELRFDYLRNVTGVDYETHLEVVYHLLSLTSKHVVAVKLRTERDSASVPSATPVWRSAEWNEREIYDLLGVDFPGHPDMRRIMMPDDWVGHPLRKDYEPLDSEV
ncbi:MAG: dehydrogenase, subunit [Paenibacillus sp.]|jgi:NADH-quinone oxidoreductase subunit C|nr:dehydrogenase, subunit [Paenibacillus sp.]